MSETIATQFAPAEKSDPHTIAYQRKRIENYLGPFRRLFDTAVSEIFLIVNQNRQIVFYSAGFPELVDTEDPEHIYGMRPGEAIECVNSCKTPGGCGTSEFCSQCGGVKTMLSALSNQPDTRECWISRKDGLEAIELLVRSTPLTVDQERYSVVAFTDISHEKRRRALEKVFFHDVMNTAESIHMFIRMLNSEADADNSGIFRQHLQAGISQLIEQLHSQKALLSAENNELEIRENRFDGSDLIREVADALRKVFPEHHLRLGPGESEVPLKTDRELLRRVLKNMMRNALEASRPEQVVSVSCGVNGGWAEFRVHNVSPIPAEDQLQIFQRSFSTKGPGRGLGTYSIKLLTERYLGGRVDFTSSAEHGTTFTARYPLDQNP